MSVISARMCHPRWFMRSNISNIQKYRSSSVVLFPKPFPLSFSLRQHLETTAVCSSCHSATFLRRRKILPRISRMFLLSRRFTTLITYDWFSCDSRLAKKQDLEHNLSYACLLSKTLTPNISLTFKWVRKEMFLVYVYEDSYWFFRFFWSLVVTK